MDRSDKAPRCPVCRTGVERAPQNPDFPFCSARCKRVDLGRWFGEAYTIAGEPVEGGELPEGPDES